MGGGVAAGSAGSASNGMLANLLGGANASAGGSALQLGLGVEAGSPGLSNLGGMPGMPFTEHNVPSRPGY